MKLDVDIRSRLGPRLNSALYIFLFFGCAAFAGVGATVAFLNPTRPRVVGAVAMIAATAVAVGTVRLWKTVLPAIFAGGAVNALLVAIERHALDAPDVPVARPLGVLLTLAMIGAAIATALANRRQFTFVERMSFVGIFICFALLFSSFGIQATATIGSLCCACVPLVSGFVARRWKPPGV